MSSRLKLWGACRTLAIRARPAPRAGPFVATIQRPRWYSSDNTTTQQPPKPIENSTDAKPEPSSAEAAAGGESVAKDASEANGSEVTAPQPISSETLDDATLEQLFFGGSRGDAQAEATPEGGLTKAQEDTLYREGNIPPPDVAEALNAQAEKAEQTELVESATGVENPGHKFGLPRWPSKEGIHMKKRYHPVLEQITRLLMQDGKLSVAQRNMAIVMNYLRTAPPPIYSPKFPLLPGTPPAAYLPLNPILYITVAIDSVAPLIKVRNISGAGGGGRALELPMPLEVRQRRRVAFKWIMDVVTKKPSKGSGRKQFPYRLAEEIIAVVEGRSGVWEKRKLVHKLGTAARANVGSNKLKVKKK